MKGDEDTERADEDECRKALASFRLNFHKNVKFFLKLLTNNKFSFFLVHFRYVDLNACTRHK